MQRNAKWTLTALIVVCTLPVVASYLTYYFWQPSERVNYGELISPTPLPPATAQGFEGQPSVDLASISGRWILVYAGPGRCDAGCEQSLYTMRQTWLAQGEEMRRVDRLWLVTDGVEPRPEVLADQRNLKVVKAAPEWLAKLPGHEAGTRVYLVDPIGNVMMRFPQQPDIKLVIKDLQRLLKYSGLG